MSLTIQYNREQLLDLLKCQDDPLYFINNFIKIQHPYKGVLPFDLFDHQADLINTYKTDNKIIVKWPRQHGETVATCAFILWYAIFNPHRTIIISSAANVMRARDNLDIIRGMNDRLPDYLRLGLEYNNKNMIQFDNMSSIIVTAFSEHACRGRNVDILYISDYAYAKTYTYAVACFRAMVPAIWTCGKIIISSTPNGFNHFYELFISCDFTNKTSSWRCHPDRDELFKDKMFGLIGEIAWQQEYEGEFIEQL